MVGNLAQQPIENIENAYRVNTNCVANLVVC